jgi:hypothetical protein
MFPILKIIVTVPTADTVTHASAEQLTVTSMKQIVYLEKICAVHPKTRKSGHMLSAICVFYPTEVC